MRTLASLGMIACALFARDGAAQSSTLEGYHLGQTWSEIGRAIPCQLDSLPDNWKAKVKSCWPNGDTVRLWFVRDTLYEVSYVPAVDDTLPAEVLWNRHWKEWSIARYGAPDSVTTSGTHLSQVTAFWHKGSTFVQIEILSAPGGHAGLVHVELCGARTRIACRSSWLGLPLVGQ